MPDGTMIRKQLYITRAQERALKERARKEGLTEAQIVREALERHLRHENGPFISEDQRKLVEELIAMNKEVSRHHRFAKGYTFNREELYAEREDRWFENRDEK